MSAKNKLPPKAEIDQVMQMIFSDAFRENPYLFVVWAFPWLQKGGRLENQKGPRAWQKKELLAIGAHIKRNKERIARGESPEVYRLAVSSGRGIGKSALVSWLTIWMLSCHYGSTVIVSANTDSQISDITFAEIGKWLTLSNVSFMFEQTQKKISPAPWYTQALKEMRFDDRYYYIIGKLWDEDSPSSFAGAHSDLGMLVIFDEASGIPTTIWDVTEGYFSDKTLFRFWLAFSNPRSSSGGFFDCFHHPDSTWQTRQINSLDIEDLDHEPFQNIIKKYGADSDKAAIEVFGKFPKTGERQFISTAVVNEAAERIILDYSSKHEPLLMGVDVARFGSDSTVFAFRAGRDARSIPFVEMNGADNMQVVSRMIQLIYQFNPDHVFVDNGYGTGVIDRMRELGYKIHEVGFGTASTEPHYFDHRSEIWARMRDWLPGAMIPRTHDLISGLTAPEKEFVGREMKEKLESKEKMRRRGVSSPDHADALACTFHMKVASKENSVARQRGKSKRYRPESKGLLD